MQALPLPLSYAAIGIVSILDLCCHWRAVVSTLRPHRQQSCEPTLLALHLIHSLDVHQREGVGHEGKQIARTGVVHQATIAIYRLLPLLAKGEDDLLDPSRLAIADVAQETSLASQLLVGVEIVTVDGTFVAITTWVHCDDGAAELLAVIKRL